MVIDITKVQDAWDSFEKDTQDFALFRQQGQNREFFKPTVENIEKSVEQMKRLHVETDKFERGIKQSEKAANDLGFVFESRLEDVIVSMTEETVKLRDIMRALSQDILRTVVRRTATEPLGNLVTTGINAVTSSATNYFVDARGAQGDTEQAINRAFGNASQSFQAETQSAWSDSFARGGQNVGVF